MPNNKLKYTLYLASKSPRRQEILNEFQIPFEITENLLQDEELHLANSSLRSKVRLLAKRKAITSKKSLQGLILGVDTIVVLNNHILGKPQNITKAKEFLSLLSGKTHQVISAFALYNTITKKTLSRSAVTNITFKTLSTSEIEFYCTNYQVLDKAGAYGIQEYAGEFVTKIEGSFYNVVGLPIELLLNVLKKYAIV